ncbi:MAG: hypothetical protein LKE41_02160 [Prevotella sp.]|jgi:hypothetical protein|nr:hypothetical protein [Prevotella sp.]MCI2081223.1 hypothetical protein [Prevotella sp.]MCI2103082.1 hypothetical protein [Prevotella sp.]
MANSKTMEQQRQAESDAMTMANYQEIISNKARLNRAIKVAKRKAKELSNRTSAMQTVARTKRK